jgi:hypothetical protein
MKITSSKFVSSVKVAYITEDDDEYKKLSKFFKMHGYAFLTNSIIFIDETSLRKDNFFKKNYLLFIESHEIAHMSLDHKSLKRNKIQEAEADYVGVLLCEDKNMNAAANVGKKYFSARNGISFSKYHEKYGESVRSQLV